MPERSGSVFIEWALEHGALVDEAARRFGVRELAHVQDGTNLVYRGVLDGRPVALRMTPHALRPHSETVAELEFVRALSRRDLPVARPRPSRQQQLVEDLGQVSAAAFDWLGDLKPASEPTWLRRTGELTARLHQAAAALPAVRRRGWREEPFLLDGLGLLEEREDSQMLERAETVLSRVGATCVTPVVPSHGDLGPQNLRVVDGELCVFDFGNLGDHHAGWDLATSAAAFRADDVDALRAGYAEHREAPGLDEIDALFELRAVYVYLSRLYFFRQPTAVQAERLTRLRELALSPRREGPGPAHHRR